MALSSYRTEDPRGLVSLALFGAILVHAVGIAASAGPEQRHLWRFLFFGGGAIALPLCFLGVGWSAFRWAAQAGSATVIKGALTSTLAAVCWSAMICSPLLVSSPEAGQEFLKILPVLGLFVPLTVVAVALQRSGFVAAPARILAPLVARLGGLILLSLPAAALFFTMEDWYGMPLSMPAMPDYRLLLVYSSWFGAGWWFASSSTLFDQVTRRWRLRLIVAFVLSFALYAAQRRHNSAVPIDEPRRMLFCLTYVLFTWRSVLALAGAYRAGKLRVPRKLVRIAEASFCCYCIHGPWMLWFERKMARPEIPVAVRFLALCAGTVAIAWGSYEVTVRKTVLRTWLAWHPTAEPTIVGASRVIPLRAAADHAD